MKIKQVIDQLRMLEKEYGNIELLIESKCASYGIIKNESGHIYTLIRVIKGKEKASAVISVFNVTG